MLPNTKKISLCMIVRDEESHIHECLSAIKDVVDEIIIVDTGSLDSTRDIAESLGALVLDYKWDDDFSKPRNLSIKNASGEWILILDADEIIQTESKAVLREIIKDTSIAGYFIYINSIGRYGLVETRPILRLFRRSPDVCFKYRIHEQVYPSLKEFAEKSGLKIAYSPIHVIHKGYTEECISKGDKLARNISLLLKQLNETPDDPYFWLKLGETYRRSKDKGSRAKALSALEQAYRLFIRLPETNASKRQGQGLYSFRLSYGISIFSQYANELVANNSDNASERQGKSLYSFNYERQGSSPYPFSIYEKAIAIINEGLIMYPNSITLLYTRAYIYQKLGMFDHAINDYLACINTERQYIIEEIEIAPYHTFNSLGEVYRLKGERDKAKEYYLKAIAINSSFNLPRHNFAKIYIEEGELKRAEEEYRIIRGKDKYDITALLSGALVLIEERNLDEALIWVNEVLRLVPDQRDATHLLEKIKSLTFS